MLLEFVYLIIYSYNETQINALIEQRILLLCVTYQMFILHKLYAKKLLVRTQIYKNNKLLMFW